MRGRFIGNPANNGEGAPEITFFGVTFPKGEWVNYIDPTVASRLAGNTHFEFQTDAEAAEADAPVEKPKKGKAKDEPAPAEFEPEAFAAED